MMKKRTLKRMAAIVLAGVMALSAAGCGSSKPEAEGPKLTEGSSDGYQAGDTYQAAEPITYTMLYSDHENYPTQDNWLLWQAIKEKTNVDFKKTVVARTDYTDKRSLLISSGDAPLILPKIYPGEENQFVASGALLPISDYAVEDYMPNYCKKVKDWNMEKDLNAIRQDNGKYYILPGLHEVAFTDYAFLIRKDIFDQAGIKIDESNYTYEQFTEDMKKVKAAYPDQYVMSDRFSGESLLNQVAAAYGCAAGWQKKTGEKFDFEKNEFYFSPVSEGYRTFVTMLNDWVESGVLDPESFTQDDDSAIADFTTGKSFVISTNTQTAQDLMQKMDASLGKGNYELLQVVPPTGDQGNVLPGASRLENGVAINADAAELGEDGLKQLLRFVDWLWYSDEGQMLTKWGVEGTTYDMVDGKPVLKEDIYYNGVNPDASKQLNTDYGFSGGVFAYGGSRELVTSMYSDYALDYYNKATTLREAAPITPPLMFDEDTAESMALITTPLMDYVTQMTKKFILGQEDIAGKWDSYVDNCKGLKYESFIEQCNKTYEGTKDNLK